MQYISFKLNENIYSIPILKVQEIIKFPPIVRLPLTPAFLVGVTNLRGRVIPIIDPKSLMELKCIDENELPRTTDHGLRADKVIIVNLGQIIFGVVVDEITGLRNIEDSMVESPEKVLGNAGRQVEGVVKENDELVMLIDPTKLVPIADMKLLEENIISIEQQGDKVEVIKMVQGEAERLL